MGKKRRRSFGVWIPFSARNLALFGPIPLRAVRGCFRAETSLGWVADDRITSMVVNKLEGVLQEKSFDSNSLG
jgi:hypothetical protein